MSDIAGGSLLERARAASVLLAQPRAQRVLDGLSDLTPAGRSTIDAMIEKMAATHGADLIRLASDLIAAAGLGARGAAKAYFRATLKDTTVKTVIGDVRIIGGTLREMDRGMKSDGLKAALVPLVPMILSEGEYAGREDPSKDRGGVDFAAFHFFRKSAVEVGGVLVDVGVSVVERAPGTLEFALTAYGLGHSGAEYWAKKIGVMHPLARAADKTPTGSQPTLDSILPEADDDCNIVILNVAGEFAGGYKAANAGALDSTVEILAESLQAGGILDAANPLARAHAAAALTAKAVQYRTAAGLSALGRLHLARDIRDLIAQLGGAANEAPSEPEALKALRAIAKGAADGESLAELYGRMQEAISALTEADGLTGEAEAVAQDAITHWAELESNNVAA